MNEEKKESNPTSSTGKLKEMLTPQNLKILVVGLGVLVVILLLRSCGGEKRVDAVQNGAAAAEKQEKRFDGSVDLTKSVKSGEKDESFAGFKFGTTADKFENVTAKKGVFGKEGPDAYYEAVVPLKKPIRMFDMAALTFTVKDRRLFKVTLKTSKEKLEGIKPIAIMREAHYCAKIIERKYGERFRVRNTNLYFVDGEGEGRENVARLLNSIDYVHNGKTKLAIAPESFYHGVFHDFIEVSCFCGGLDSDSYIGVTLSVVNHEIIEEDGGRTKTLDLDENDAEGDF